MAGLAQTSVEEVAPHHIDVAMSKALIKLGVGFQQLRVVEWQT